MNFHTNSYMEDLEYLKNQPIDIDSLLIMSSHELSTKTSYNDYLIKPKENN